MDDENGKEVDEDEVTAAFDALLTICKRACRACPWSGDLWAAQIRALERAGSAFVGPIERASALFASQTDRAAVFQEALNTKLLLVNGIDEFVKVVLARVDFHRRVFDEVLAGERQPEEVQVDPIDVLIDGIKKIKRGASRPSDCADRQRRRRATHVSVSSSTCRVS